MLYSAVPLRRVVTAPTSTYSNLAIKAPNSDLITLIPLEVRVDDTRHNFSLQRYCPVGVEMTAFLRRLMSRSIEPIVFANSISALAISSIFCSVVLLTLNAALAKDSADDALNALSQVVIWPGFLIYRVRYADDQLDDATPQFSIFDAHKCAG